MENFQSEGPSDLQKQQDQIPSRVQQKLGENWLDKHRIIFPAKLLVTHDDRTHTFDTPTAVNQFIAGLREEA